MRCHGGCEHAYKSPEDDDAAEDAAEVEALEGKGHGVQAGEHAEVEERSRPGETAGVCRGWFGSCVDDAEGEVFCHAEEDGGSEDGFVVVD